MRKLVHRVAAALALAAMSLPGCDGRSPTEPDLSGSADLPPSDAAFARRLPAPVVIDFQSPILTSSFGDFYEVFEEPSTGVLFDAPDAPSHISVSLVTNTGAGTSACVLPANAGQQVLGTGPVDHPGFSGEAIEAVFPRDLPPNRVISARFQSGLGVRVSIHLFDAEGNEIAYEEELIQDPLGVCPGNIGEPRGQATVYASARDKVRKAIFDVPGGGRVFVIDDVAIQPPRGTQ